jgi:flagellar basal-body rod modification protein FlgD
MSTIQNPVTAASTSAAVQSQKMTMGKDDFLNLLITQMKNQDPMDPMKGTDYAAQLAQFSSLEQLTNISGSLDQSLTSNALMTNSITNALATTFIGKDVRAAASSFQYTGGTAVNMGYALPSSCENATMKIYDSSGTLIRTLEGTTANGINKISWDGKNDKGALVGSGNYTFKVQATDQNGAALDATTYLVGKVTGIRFKSDGAVFVIDGVEVPLSNIVEITQG